MRNIALKLEYLGTNYHGWQIQKNASTVAQTLQDAIAHIVQHPVNVIGAGRTDAGVHAKIYLANFRTTSQLSCDRLPIAINSQLPSDIVVTKATEVPLEFHAIGSCYKKEYSYYIYNSPFKNPFWVNRAWFYAKPLNETILQNAAQQFIGTHDFAAVRSVGTETKSTVRTIYSFKVTRKDNLICFRVSADGFLYNMVRAMIGTCVHCAEGKLDSNQIHGVLQSKDRSLAGPTAPAQGLYMTNLWYEDMTIL